MSREFRRDAACVLLLALSWLLVVVAVNPVGDFPLLDDWSYAASVGVLIHEGRIWFSDWGATNLISLVMWGALFSELFGFNHTVLRISVLVLTLLGNLALFGLLRTAGTSRPVAVLATSCAMYNPVSFFLSFSFMTDTSYTALQTLAMWLVVSGALARKQARTLLGWTFAAVAQLCRQIAIALAIGAAAARLAHRRPTVRLVLVAAAPLVFLAAVQLAYKYSIQVTGVAPRLYGYQAGNILHDVMSQPGQMAWHALKLPIYFLFYGGFFLLPLLLATARQWAGWLSPRSQAAPLALLAGVAGGLAYTLAVVAGRSRPFPIWWDILNHGSGLGPERAGTPPPAILEQPATFLAAGGAVLLVLALAGAVVQCWRRPAAEGFNVRLFGLVTALVLLAPLALITLRFDRYLIPIIPCLCVAIAPRKDDGEPSPPWLGAGVVLVLAMGLFSTLATHDYLAWKRAQAAAFEDLRRTVPVERIDAGWVLNGSVSDARELQIGNILKWRKDADYAIRGVPRPGFATVRTYPVRRYAPWTRDAQPILVQRRLSPLPGPDAR